MIKQETAILNVFFAPFALHLHPSSIAPPARRQFAYLHFSSSPMRKPYVFFHNQYTHVHTWAQVDSLLIIIIFVLIKCSIEVMFGAHAQVQDHYVCILIAVASSSCLCRWFNYIRPAFIESQTRNLFIAFAVKSSQVKIYESSKKSGKKIHKFYVWSISDSCVGKHNPKGVNGVILNLFAQFHTI